MNMKIAELKSPMSRFIYDVVKPVPVLQGDPIIQVDGQYVVLHGKGDFRQTQQMAMEFIMLAEGVPIPKGLRL